MTTHYQANPDVSCREETEDGALLFNPDNARSSVINPVGLLIWQYLNSPRTVNEIVTYLMEVCEDIPTDQVANDVNEFLQTLLPDEFVQEVGHDAS